MFWHIIKEFKKDIIYNHTYEHGNLYTLIVWTDGYNSARYDVDLCSEKWLQHLELEIGKLKPLPKTKFDFVQYLLDNGFKTEETLGNICIRKEMFTIGFNVINKSYYYKDKKIQPTEANAKIVVEMAKLSEELS